MISTEKRQFKFSRRFKVVIGLVLAFLFVLFSALLYLSIKLEPIVAMRLKETVKTSTNGLYSISFSGIHLNPFAGSIKIDNVEFRPNDSTYQKLLKQNLHPTHLYSIRIASLTLKKAHPIQVYFDRELHLKTLHIDRPVVKVYYQNPRNDNNEPEDKRSTWQRLSKYLKVIKMEEIIFDNINFQYIDRSSGKPEIDGVKNLSINIKDLLIDSLSEQDKSRFYFTKEIFVRIKKHEYVSRDKLYNITFNDLSISSSARYALVRGLQISPRYPDMEFYKHVKERKARMHLTLNAAQLLNIDFKRLVTKRQLRASSLTLSNANLNVFLDLRNKRPEYDRGKNFPQLALQRLVLNTTIDTVSILNSAITYSEYTPVTARRGKVFFNKINASIYNFSNDSSNLRKHPWARSKFSMLFYGKSKLSLKLNFNLLSPMYSYNYSGQLSAMNAKNFNLLSRPLALLRINAGKISGASFSVNANYRNAKGKLILKYKDLNIGLLRIDSNKVLHKQMLRSLVANNVLLKEANPSSNGIVRIGQINYSRPDSIAFFGFMWQSIYTGLRETIGLSQEREQELVDQFRSFNQKSPDERDRIRGKRKVRRKDRRTAKMAR
ncbi:hypothetical protein [Desertivirga arenae]|uniref:hypothetical protein n=1 Tax=Desertivirga arenae TaxID=2810309 RepID=UPI001A959477|nr:hypothetical protein [Pedobacter sp. SYSU D00823]